MSERHTHCGSCGTVYEDTSGYPRACATCGAMVWDNPTPVSVVLVPVPREGREGLLVVRRGIEPQKGKLALVGGFLEAHETWQVGGAREVMEETGVEVAADALSPFWFVSTDPKPNRVLLFSIAPSFEGDPDFEPNDETLERGLIFGPDGLEDVFAFPLHIEAVRRFFADRDIEGEHDFTVW